MTEPTPEQVEEIPGPPFTPPSSDFPVQDLPVIDPTPVDDEGVAQ